MTLNDFDYLAQLPGQEREQNWIRERLRTLSVREGVVLAAAVLCWQPRNATDAINQLQYLDHYRIVLDAGSHEALGKRYYEDLCENVPAHIRHHINFERLGEQFEYKHPGLFIGGCYVKYTDREPELAYRGGDAPLPVDDQWTIKVKLASSAQPDGVWLRLPGPQRESVRIPDEERELAFQQLGVNHLDDCTLLDAVCILPQVKNLMQEFNSISELVSNGNYLAQCLRLECRMAL